MKRTEFAHELAEKFKKVMPSDVTISVETTKNGEILYLATTDNKKIGVSVEQLQDIYNENGSLDDVLKSVLETYKNSLDITKTLENFEDAKSKIHFALINKNHRKFDENNNPHIAMEDLRLLLAIKLALGDNVITTFVTNGMLKSWNVTFEELYKIAESNSKPSLFRLTDTFLGVSGSPISYGAGELWGKETTEALKNHFGDNGFYIIPSSVDELIAVDGDGVDLERIESIEQTIANVNGNKNLVTEKDYLSDKLYYFDIETNKLIDAKKHYFGTNLS